MQRRCITESTQVSYLDGRAYMHSITPPIAAFFLPFYYGGERSGRTPTDTSSFSFDNRGGAVNTQEK
eukprot:3475997-Ditylum_brightwellii.AAC.1